MPHTIEPASSGRARCRGCGQAIAKGELRLGERFPNPFADEGEMTLWFHLVCGAYKRPQAILEVLGESGGALERGAWLAQEARRGVEHRRLPRFDGAERSPTGRAACRSCREKIPKGSWRIRLVFFEDGRFEPSGFIHAGCVAEYMGTTDVLGRVTCFSSGLGEQELASLRAALAGSSETPPSD